MRKISIRAWFAHASLLASIVVDRLDLPPLLTWVAAAVSMVLYATGIWKWSGQFQHLNKAVREQQRHILRWTVTGLFAFLCLSAFMFYYRLVPTRSSEQQTTIARYRHILEGIDIPQKTGLIELTNEELKNKGTNLYKRIKEMNTHYSKAMGALRARRDLKEIDATEFERREREERTRAANEFEKDYRVDARMTLLELRNRIPVAARKHILGLPGIREVGDDRGGTVSMYDLPTPAMFTLAFSELLAREIEELVKLLPDR